MKKGKFLYMRIEKPINDGRLNVNRILRLNKKISVSTSQRMLRVIVGSSLNQNQKATLGNSWGCLLVGMKK